MNNRAIFGGVERRKPQCGHTEAFRTPTLGKRVSNEYHHKVIKMNNTIKSETQPLLTVVEGQVKTTSLDIAEKFSKQHKDVMRSIRQLGCSESFSQRNFAPTSFKDSFNRDQPMYDITRDGFCFLVMGFIVREADAWKESYINAFNRMETELNKMHRPKLAESERRLLRTQKQKLVQLLTRAKTEFEHEQYLADLQELSVALGQPSTEISGPVINT